MGPLGPRLPPHAFIDVVQFATDSSESSRTPQLLPPLLTLVIVVGVPIRRQRGPGTVVTIVVSPSR